jgi:nucleotide-binding universal stress UspA family protein
MARTSRPYPGPVVVGVERSERSRDAVALGRTLARAVGTDLLLVAVYPAGGRSSVMPPDTFDRTLSEEAEATLEWVSRPFTGVPTTTRALACTSITRGLHSVADAEGALAIVVGPTHRGGLGGVLPGSVGERLLRSAPCPVAVAPSGYRSAAPSSIRRIGVGFTPTPEADEALDAAVVIATLTGAAVHALSVVEPPSGVLMGIGWSYAEHERLARIDLDGGLALAREASTTLAIEGEVADGYADDELARLSTEVDLLVCGSRGRGPLGRVMLGSVSAGVLRKARCPVLVIPRGAPDGFLNLRAAGVQAERPSVAVAANPLPGRSS